MTISKAVKMAILVSTMTFALAINASSEECPEIKMTSTNCNPQVKELTWWDKLTNASFIQFNIFDLIELIKKDSNEYRDFSDKGPTQSI